MKSCRKKVKWFSIEEIGIYCCLGFCCLVTFGVCLFLVLWVLFCGFVCLFVWWVGFFVCLWGLLLVLLFQEYSCSVHFFTITSWKLETGFSFKGHLVLSSRVTLIFGFPLVLFFNSFLSSGHKPTQFFPYSMPVSSMMQLYAIDIAPKQGFLEKLASIENTNYAALQQLGTNVIDPYINYGYCLFAFHFLGNNIMVNKYWLAKAYCTWDYKTFKEGKIAYFSPQTSFKLIYTCFK